MSDERITRREVLKKAAYVTPMILTMKANFAFASAGSGDYSGVRPVEYLGRGDEKDEKENKHKKHKKEKHEKENTDNNDKKNWTNKTRF